MDGQQLLLDLCQGRPASWLDGGHRGEEVPQFWGLDVARHRHRHTCACLPGSHGSVYVYVNSDYFTLLYTRLMYMCGHVRDMYSSYLHQRVLSQCYSDMGSRTGGKKGSGSTSTVHLKLSYIKMLSDQTDS